MLIHKKGNLLDMADNGDFDIIVQGCNCFNAMGAGLAPQIAKRYPMAEAVDSDTRKGSISKLGNWTYAWNTEDTKARTESRKQNGEWLSKETKEKISKSNTGKKGYWGDNPITEEMIEKRKKTMRETGGWEWTEERREAQRQRLLGKPSKNPPVTEERKQQLREEKSKKVTCPHCGKEGTMMIMPRWHFDNCKKLTQK